MKGALATVFLVLLVAALLWFSRARDGADEAAAAAAALAPAPQAEAGLAPDPVAPGREPATAEPASTVPERAERPPRGGLAELEARVRELTEARSEDMRAWQAVLSDLVRLGTPEAIAAVLAVLQDPGCEFAHRGTFFAQLLAPVDDPRIVPAARAVVDANLAAGLDSWVDTRGYLELVARKGGAAEGPYLAALLGRRGQVASIAAENVAHLAGETSPDPFLEALNSPRNDWYVRDLAASLASWDDPRVDARLVELAESPGTPMMLRQQVLNALASEVEPDELAQFASWYRSADDDGERALALGALGYLGDRTNAADADVAAAVVPLLVDALGQPARETWMAAVYAIGDREEFHVPAVRDALAALLPAVVSEEDQEEVRGTLTRVQRTLR